MVYVGGVDDLVEAGIFDGCSDDGAAGVGAGCPGDYIDVRSTDYKLKRKGGRQGDGEHLALFRYDLNIG